MGGVPSKSGVACKWFGSWLLVTAGLLFYGETAPDTVSPDFKATIIVMLLGAFFYSMGCACYRKAKAREERQRMQS